MRNCDSDWSVACEAYFRRLHPEAVHEQTGISLHFLTLIYEHMDRVWPSYRKRALRPYKPIDTVPHRG